MGVKDETLQAEIQALTEERDQAVALANAKGQFLAKMSHEIRTPLNGIIGMTELFGSSTMSKEQQEAISIVRSSAAHLLGVVNEILDFSKIEAGRLNLNPEAFAIREVFDSQLRVFTVEAETKGIEFTWELPEAIPEVVIGDARRLFQVVVNLVANALKFTERGGKVSLNAEVSERMDELLKVKFCVRDTGIGIKPGDEKKIFKSFVQVDSSVGRGYGGTGLGLPIAANLVQLMGGEIWVDPQESKGATFYFTVLFREGTAEQVPDSNESSKNTAESESITGGKILLVEDNIVNQKVACGLLRKKGFEVTVAENGVDALKKIDGDNFDIVLMDCEMPLMDGYSTAKKIRERESGGERIPILALTANVLVGEEERCLEAGMDAYVSKPINRDELLDKVKQYLSSGSHS